MCNCNFTSLTVVCDILATDHSSTTHFSDYVTDKEIYDFNVMWSLRWGEGAYILYSTANNQGQGISLYDEAVSSTDVTWRRLQNAWLVLRIDCSEGERKEP
jgi:hypothetical protein